MTTDPIDQLREELLRAARRSSTRHPATRRRARVPRGALVAAIIAGGAAVPGIAYTAGAIDLGGGPAPDGSTYEIERFSDGRSAIDPTAVSSEGRVCERIEFKLDDELTTRITGCAPADRTIDGPLVASSIVAPDDGRLVTGTVSPQVARVTVSGKDTPVELRDVREADRRFFSAITPVANATVVAYADDGTEVERVRLPL